jgi:hypothetical protein
VLASVLQLNIVWRHIVRTYLIGVTVAALCGLTMPAYAAKAVITLSAATVGAALDNAGYSYTQRTGDDGSPVIDVDVGDLKAEQVVITFYECDAQGACQDILLWSWYSTPKRTAADVINSWNADTRWVRAYLDKDKDPVLEMDINATGGIGNEALQILINTYFEFIPDFTTHLGM